MSENKLTITQALTQAVEHHKNGRLEEAERLYKAILQTDPRHPVANHNLGVLAVSVDKPDAGLAYLKTAVEANPSQGQYWLSFIDALIKADRLEAARKAIDKGRSLGLAGEKVDRLEKMVSGNTEHIQKSVFQDMIDMRESGRYKEALKWLDNHIETGPDSPEAHAHSAHILLQMGRLSEANEVLKKALAIGEALPIVQRNLSRLLLAVNKPAEALNAARRAHQSEPDNPENQLVLASALTDPKEALMLIRSALQGNPKYAEAYAQRVIGARFIILDSPRPSR